MNPILGLSSDAAGHRHHRVRHGLRGSDHRQLPARHQKGAGVLHGLPDRLHGARRRLRAYIAALFLMVCHAFYKGLLFLAAGS